MQVGGYPNNIKFGGVDCQFDINTGNGATEANTFTLIDECKFDAVTVDDNGIFDCSGQLAEFGGTSSP